MDTKRKKQTVSFGLDPKTLEAYERIAQEERRTLASALRIALEDQLGRRTQPQPSECSQ